MQVRCALVLVFGFLAIAAVAAACGGDGGTVPEDTGAQAGDASPSSAAAVEDLCGLLPKSDIERITGYKAGQVDDHKGPEFLHFCTIYVKVPDCGGNCALSLEDLGALDGKTSNDAQSYRETLIDINADYEPVFADGVVGGGSWLATFTAGDAEGIKILYFNTGGVAFDLTSPRIKGGAVTADQMIVLAEVALAAAAR